MVSQTQLSHKAIVDGQFVKINALYFIENPIIVARAYLYFCNIEWIVLFNYLMDSNELVITVTRRKAELTNKILGLDVKIRDYDIEDEQSPNAYEKLIEITDHKTSSISKQPLITRDELMASRKSSASAKKYASYGELSSFFVDVKCRSP